MSDPSDLHRELYEQTARERDDLRARLAEVEAENERLRVELADREIRIGTLNNALAAVERADEAFEERVEAYEDSLPETP